MSAPNDWSHSVLPECLGRAASRDTKVIAVTWELCKFNLIAQGVSPDKESNGLTGGSSVRSGVSVWHWDSSVWRT